MLFLKKFTGNRGFTMIELMVTISILVLFAVAATAYNRTIDAQVALYREQGKVINNVYEARSLAITTFNRFEDDETPCGYGIHIASPTRLVIFKDLPSSFETKCAVYPSHTAQSSLYEGDKEDYEAVNLDGVSVEANFENVLFIPPDPQVYTDAISFPATLTLSSERIGLSLRISINQFGQISTSQVSGSEQ